MDHARKLALAEKYADLHDFITQALEVGTPGQVFDMLCKHSDPHTARIILQTYSDVEDYLLKNS